jgi:5-methylcytosine-specific restriction endonuclease McrA
MTYPKTKDIDEQLLLFIYRQNGRVAAKDCYRPIGEALGLTEEEMNSSLDEVQGSGGSRSKWQNMLQWSRNNLAKSGLVRRPNSGEQGTWILTEQGMIEAKNVAAKLDEENHSTDAWSRDELKAAVSAYVEMQVKERKGQSFVKKSYYEALALQYGRSEKAFEYRMQNISYVLSVLGRDWLNGLKPAKNVGANIAIVIEQLIGEIEGKHLNPRAEFEVKVRDDLRKPNLPKPLGNNHPAYLTATVTQYKRDASVKAWILQNANGHCECCASPAPFIGSDGFPYLEVHHVRHMADGGTDTLSNTVALCPNCHREIHYGINSKAMIEKLYRIIDRLVLE